MIRKVLFLFVFIFIISSVYSVTTIGALPYTISTPGEYNISGNLSSTGHGITITTQNASLNCEGYTMTGDGGASDYGIYINNDAYDNNNISNCNLNNFSYGIYLNQGDYNKFENLSINSTTGWSYIYNYPDQTRFKNIIFNITETNDLINGANIYFENVSNGNNLFAMSFINISVQIDGWTNISTIYLLNTDNSSIKNLNYSGLKKGTFISSYNVDYSNLTNLTNYNYDHFFYSYNSKYNLYTNITCYNINSNCLTLLTGSNYNNLINISSYLASSMGIFINGASYNNLNNIITNNGSNIGIWLLSSSNNNITNFTSSNNSLKGFAISSSSNNIISNSKISDTRESIYIFSTTNSDCNNIFSNVTDNYGKYHVYSNQSITIDGWTNISSIILCNADNSTVKNLNYDGLNDKGRFLFTTRTDYANYSNLSISNYYTGIYMDTSSNNSLSNFSSYSNSQIGVYLSSSSNNNLNNFSTYNNSQDGIYLTSSLNNNLSNFNSFKNTQRGIILTSSSYNNLSNFNSYNNTMEGIYLISSSNNNRISYFNCFNNSDDGIFIFSSCNYNSFNNFNIYFNINNGINDQSNLNNNYSNFNIYNNTQQGIYLSNTKNNIFTNFSIINLSTYGVLLSSLTINNTFLNGTIINNTLSNLNFDENGANKPVNNTFYNNYLGNISKIYSDNWTNINYFNSSLSGYNIGNYWNDFGVCSVKTLVGPYGVCANPANYTINSTNNIYDFAPLYNPYEIDSCTNLTIAGGNYYMTANILNSATSNCINISANNITFDCRGFTIDGNDAASNGIYLYRSSVQTTNVTIKNCIVSDFASQNINIFGSSLNNLTNITTNSTSGNGINLQSNANNNTLNEFRSYNNAYGIYIYASYNNTVINSVVNDSTVQDINNFVSSYDNECNHLFTNVTDSYGKYHFYSNYSVNIDGWTNISSITLCNADNSTITNLNYDGSNDKGTFIHLRRTDYSNLTRLNISNYYHGISLSASSNNNLSNNVYYNNSNHGIYLESSNNNLLNNFNSNYDNSGVYFWASSNNIITNFNSVYNINTGIYLSTGSSNNNISNFNSSYNPQGIKFYRDSDNNKIYNGTIINNVNNNLYFSEFFGDKPQNNIFYNNYLGNISKLYSQNWSYINYFNYTLSGVGNIGNYWNDLGVCSSYQTIGTYKVCLNPANYTINSTNNIYDFAPLIVVPEYISPTPDNDTHFGGDSFTISVEDTQGVSTWFNVTFNGVTYVMSNTSSTVYEYTFYPDYDTITVITYNVSYSGNGMLETRVLTYYPTPSVFQRVPAFGMSSYALAIILIIFGGFLA